MYCSRCNGLLLEGFMQIIMYGKSLQNEGTVTQGSGYKLGNANSQTVEKTCLTIDCNDDIQDPSVHPWGGLTTTRDGTLTLLDCYIYSKYLKGLQNVSIILCSFFFRDCKTLKAVILHFVEIRCLTVPEQGSESVNYFTLMRVEEGVVDGLAKGSWDMEEVMEPGKHVLCILLDFLLTLWLIFGLHLEKRRDILF